MSQYLRLQLSRAEGALLRVIGTVERRGFRVLACHTSDGPIDAWQLDLHIEGPRDLDVLCRQLLRLLDVHCATPASPPQREAARASLPAPRPPERSTTA